MTKEKQASLFTVAILDCTDGAAALEISLVWKLKVDKMFQYHT